MGLPTHTPLTAQQSLNYPCAPRDCQKCLPWEGTPQLKARGGGRFAFHCILFWILYHLFKVHKLKSSIIVITGFPRIPLGALLAIELQEQLLQSTPLSPNQPALPPNQGSQTALALGRPAATPCLPETTLTPKREVSGREGEVPFIKRKWTFEIESHLSRELTTRVR